MATPKLIPLFDLDYGPEEEEAAVRVLRRKWLTMGEETEAFEAEFAAFLGVKHAIAVANCTAGLHLANRAAGVGPGDEVVVPSLTFVATANAIVYAGGRPVFADVTSLDDWTVSPRDIERVLTPRTKAICVMHYGGYACDMGPIRALAAERGLRVIEDVAHAVGVSHGGRKLGAAGDVSAFSFFSNKNLAVGEGGMVCTDDDAMAAEIRLARSHGMTTLTLDRHKGHSFSYDVVQAGFNYRLDELRSALGRLQLGKLAAGNARRHAVARRYRELLRDVPGVRIPFQDHERETNFHIFPVLLDPGIDRQAFMQSLRASGVQSSIHYNPIHRFSYYRKTHGDVSLPLTEAIGEREVTLPMYPGLTEEQVGTVCDAVRRASTLQL